MYNGTFDMQRIERPRQNSSRACKYSAPANAAACSHHESCFEHGHGLKCCDTGARDECLPQTMLRQQQLVEVLWHIQTAARRLKM